MIIRLSKFPPLLGFFCRFLHAIHSCMCVFNNNTCCFYPQVFLGTPCKYFYNSSFLKSFLIQLYRGNCTCSPLLYTISTQNLVQSSFIQFFHRNRAILTRRIPMPNLMLRVLCPFLGT